jgi:hypothetical protein
VRRERTGSRYRRRGVFTANTVCFQEVREADTPYPLERPIVGRLYISKKALAEMGEPRTLIVSIAAED